LIMAFGTPHKRVGRHNIPLKTQHNFDSIKDT
jgi:hypothetical protein